MDCGDCRIGDVVSLLLDVADGVGDLALIEPFIDAGGQRAAENARRNAGQIDHLTLHTQALTVTTE